MMSIVVHTNNSAEIGEAVVEIVVEEPGMKIIGNAREARGDLY